MSRCPRNTIGTAPVLILIFTMSPGEITGDIKHQWYGKGRLQEDKM